MSLIIFLVAMFLWSIIGFAVLAFLDLKTEKTLGFEAMDFPYIFLILPFWPIIIALGDNPEPKKTKDKRNTP